ncbi:MAG: FAD-dependent oxidoreductase, partial [Myxococcota bacterium]
MSEQKSFDVAIIGAGPVGCVAALAFARRGKQVLLLEANPRTSDRFAGEWLHPPAVRILRELGVEPKPDSAYPSGQGFAVFPDDGSGPIVLPYKSPSFGMSIEHHKIVEALRARCLEDGNLTFHTDARATRIDGQNLTYQLNGGARTVRSHLIVGAAGKNKVTDAALGIERESMSYSRMAGVLLEDTEVPFEGYGHVFLGGPGPVLGYRVAPDRVRLCIDVPLTMPVNQGREATLWEGFSGVLPERMRPAFRRALEDGRLSWAANRIRPRVEFGREGLALVGDAVGHHHPLTALGMTLGFQDAVALADAKSFAAFRQERIRGSRVPEMLAVALYEVFADRSDETVSIRRAVYEVWRRSPDERLHTMGLLAGDDARALSFARSFLIALGTCSASLIGTGVRTGEWGHVLDVVGQLGDRVRWLLAGTLFLKDAEPTRPLAATAEARYGAALKAQRPKGEVVAHPSKFAMVARRDDSIGPDHALARGVQALLSQQADDGSWEGEVVWCPLLAAQYVLTCHIVGRPISPERRARILRHFERTRLEDGTWGLHELSEPYLFVTTLVYVACRLLDVNKGDVLVADAHAFIRKEGGVAAIPSWGKFWLAMLGLYDWSGVNPVL